MNQDRSDTPSSEGSPRVWRLAEMARLMAQSFAQRPAWMKNLSYFSGREPKPTQRP
jgi:hypothetical protein